MFLLLLPKLPSNYITPIYFPTDCIGSLFLAPTPIPKQHWISWNPKVYGNPIRENDISLFEFYISFILNDIMHLFMCLLCPFMFLSLWIACLWPFAHFSIVIFFLLMPKYTLLRKLALLGFQIFVCLFFFFEQRCQSCQPPEVVLSLS